MPDIDFDKVRKDAEMEFEAQELEIEIEDEEDESSDSQTEDTSSKAKRSDDDDFDYSDEDDDGDTDETGDEDSEGEGEYKGRAAKRIQQLLAERKQAREELDRLRQEREALAAESNQWRTESESSKLQSAKTLQSNLEDRVKALQREWERSYDEGDGKALSKTNAELQNANIQLTGLKNYIRQAETRMPKEDGTQERREDRGRQAPARHQDQPTPAEPDPHAKRWASRNKNWFGADRVMTAAAFEIHRDLVQEEGYNPVDEADTDYGTKAYYRELDRRLRQEFPHKFEGTEEKGAAKGGQRVMGATRKQGAANAAKSGKKVVKLSKTEREMADRLGISHTAYAKRKYELEQRKGT